MSRYLIISDTQIPFEADARSDGGSGALDFCYDLKRGYKIADENCYHVGDETDQYFGSLYKRDPSHDMSAIREIEMTLERLRRWYKKFPQMKLAISNHGLRWVRKAIDAEIPSQLLRKYEDIIGAPRGWKWKQEWIIKSKSPFRIIHGMGYSGQKGHINAAMDAGMSTAIGHLHSHAAINYLSTQGRSSDILWAMNTGCLIDNDSFAFQYGKYSRNKPCLGAAVVIDDGRRPIWHPYVK